MSEFDRSENLRRSIRRPRKHAPSPPNFNGNCENIQTEKSKNILKPIATKMRDFEAASFDFKQKTDEHFDESHAVLKQIQTQINRLEFNTTVQQQFNPPMKTDAAEPCKIPETNILIDKSNDGNIDDQFIRGFTRSSMQTTQKDGQKTGVPSSKIVNLQRSQSDTKKVEMLKVRIKQRELLTKKKVEEMKVKI
jgi:hypothetical protein